MTKGTDTKALSLTMSCDLNTDPAGAYSAWIEPAQAAAWLAPGRMTGTALIDAHVGGRFRIDMQGPDGRKYAAVGVYKELLPGQRIVKSWQWEGSLQATEVQVDLRALGRGLTQLTLIHSGFETGSLRAEHERGWGPCLEKLKLHCSRSAPR